MLNSEAKFELVKEMSPEGWDEVIYKHRPKTLGEMLGNTARRYGDVEGFISDDVRLTFSQFSNYVKNMAIALEEDYKIHKEDRVALLLATGLEFCMSFFAVTKLGAIAVPLNTRLKGEELLYQIDDSGATMLIMDPEYWSSIEPIRNKIHRVREIIVTGSELPEGTKPFYKLKDRKATKITTAKVNEWDLCCIMYTSGTTGRPKGAMQFHRGLIASGMNNAYAVGYSPHDKALCAIPLFHATGLSVLLVGSVYAGMPVVYHRQFKIADFLATIQDEQVTVLTAVPAIYQLMINHPDFNKYNLRSLRFIAYGGSAVSSETVKLLREKFPNAYLFNGYGLTETHALDICAGGDEVIQRPTSVGHPLPTNNAKIVDESGKEVLPGEPGELLLKGAKVIRGYWNLPEVSRQVIVNGWLHTGDIAKVDEDGYFYILDRIKDMVNRGGEKIYSLEVENVIMQSPKVLEAAVVAVPDEIFGEQVKAVIVLKAGEDATEDEIRAFCAEHLADYKIPKYVEFRDSLPRNPAGKVVKSLLR